MREPPPGPASVESTLRQLLEEAFEADTPDETWWGITICAPHWVLERISEETGRPIESHMDVLSVTTDSLVVTAVTALEQVGGFGFLAAFDVIGGRCLEMAACHPEVAPDRWAALTLALDHGLAPAVSVAVEMLGTSDSW
jgi:hypothetical protein